MRSLLFAAVLGIASIAAPTQTFAQYTPAVTFTGTNTLSENLPFTLGFAFRLTAETQVAALGVWAGGTLGDYLAGLWSIDGTLLRSTTVAATDPTLSGFRWSEVTPLVLAAGDYVVGAEFRSGLFPWQATGVSTIANYESIDGRFLAGTGLLFPTNQSLAFGENGILWANFAVTSVSVPEPASLSLLLLGLGVTGLTARRRRQRTS